MEVSDRLYALLKDLTVPIEQKTTWAAQSWLDALGVHEEVTSPAGNRTTIPRLSHKPRSRL